MFQKQKTLLKKTHLKGYGITVKEVNVNFNPASENTGFVFIRIDLIGKPQIRAHIDLVRYDYRGIYIEKNKTRIINVEHVLAALAGSGLDNVIIEIDSEELPIMDGSALPFLNALERGGKIEQTMIRDYYELSDVICYNDIETGGKIIAIPSKDFELLVMVDLGMEVLDSQNAVLSDLCDFKKEIAPARTFYFFHEIKILLEANLIKADNLKNAIIYINKNIDELQSLKLQKIFQKENLKILPNGMLNNLELNYTNEAARHKLLDIIGGLALVGKPLKAKIIAYKPCHKINIEFIKELYSNIKANKEHPPQFDLNKTIYDIKDIMRFLPHKPPFLLVDRIIEITDDYIIGIKNITINEPFFTGHFPKEPVFPGVLQLEALAQTGGIFVLNKKKDPQAYSTYFLKIDNVRFKQKVIPGDLLILKMELLQDIRMNIIYMQGRGYVNKKKVVEAQIVAQIVKTKNL